jgi:dTDP-4-dehydrorhamnose reductase
VVHTAYVQGGADLFEVTAGGAEIVAHRASEAAAALIVVSTDVVFDGTIEAPARYPEQQAPRPLSDYGRAKAHAEVAVASAHPGALVVRTSLIYGGPDGPRSPHEQVVLDTLEGTANWRFHTDEWRCPVQVDDLAEALVVLAAQLVDAGEPGVVVPGRGRVLHLAGSDGVTRAQFARLVASSAGLDPAAVPVGPLVDDDRPANVMLDSGAALAAGLHLRGVFSALAGRE